MPHILSLPPETLRAICANLCYHCSVPPPEVFNRYFRGENVAVESQARLAALSALVQTCTTLRAIAEPLLYHFPCAPGILRLPFRTLVERPDLARHVKQLSFAGPISEKEIPAGLVDILHTFLQEYWDGVAEERIQQARETYEWLRDPYSAAEQFGWDEEFDVMLTAMVLTKVPNLESLHFELKAELEYEFPPFEPDSFLHLKEIVVQNWDEWGGGDLTWELEPVLLAAPSLERLAGINVTCATWNQITSLIHGGVKELSIFGSQLTPNAISNLLTCFPRLEAFRYHSFRMPGGLSTEEANPREIGEAALLCKDTLRFLFIDCFYSVWQHKHQPEGAMGSLAELEHLEHLQLDSLAMSTESGCGITDIAIWDMLPASITRFDVTSTSMGALYNLLSLAAVASQTYPALRNVDACGFTDEEGEEDVETNDRMRRAFEHSGVEFSIDQPSKQWSMWIL